MNPTPLTRQKKSIYPSHLLGLLFLLCNSIAYAGIEHTTVMALSGDIESGYPTNESRDFLISDFMSKNTFKYWSANRYTVVNRLSPAKQNQITRFVESELPEVSQNSKSVIYLFGGPDSVYPNLFFPNLEKLYLVGLEDVGRLPQVDKKEDLIQYANELGKAFMSLPYRSYFVTRSMAQQLKQHGVVTVAAVGLVSIGYKIENIAYLDVTESGELYEDENSHRGVRIDYLKPNGSEASLYYFQQNLGPDEYDGLPGYKQDRRVIDHLEAQNFDTAFYKAASYAPYLKDLFKVVNALVTENVDYVVQTDSGLKDNEFSDNEWDRVLFGQYTIPNLSYSIMKNFQQPELQSAFDQGICDSSDKKAQSQLKKLRGDNKVCDSVKSNLLGVTWKGLLPFRYGYASHLTGPTMGTGRGAPADDTPTNACGTATKRECKSYANHLLVYKRRK